MSLHHNYTSGFPPGTGRHWRKNPYYWISSNLRRKGYDNTQEVDTCQETSSKHLEPDLPGSIIRLNSNQSGRNLNTVQGWGGEPMHAPNVTMSGIVWNCQVIGHPTTIRSLRNMTASHRPFFIFLSETKCSCVDKVSVFVKKIGFQKHEFVPAKGLSRGLLLMWQSNFCIEVVLSTEFLVNCLIFYDSYQDPWQLTFVYGPPNHAYKR